MSLSLCGCARLSIDKQLKQGFWTLGSEFEGEGIFFSYDAGDYYQFSDGNKVVYRPDWKLDYESGETYSISDLMRDEGDLGGVLTIEYTSDPRAGETESFMLVYLRQQGVLSLHSLDAGENPREFRHIVEED